MLGRDAVYDLLYRCVRERGPDALSVLDQFIRDADGLEEIFPAYVALASWGERGFEMIARQARDGSTVKLKSAALTLFTCLAARGEVPETLYLPIGHAFRVELNGRLSGSVRAEARNALRELVAAIDVDDLFLPISQTLMHVAESNVADELIAALSTRWFAFGRTVLRQYSGLISDHPTDEPKFQDFFCEHPQLLDPMALQVWSQPDFHGGYEPDFVIRRADNTYLIVEIETPAKLIVTVANQVAADATHAEAQALEYAEFLEGRVHEARHHFPNFTNADCLAVIGLQEPLNQRQLQALARANRIRGSSRIAAFDWLLERSRATADNISEGGVQVIRGARLI